MVLPSEVGLRLLNVSVRRASRQGSASMTADFVADRSEVEQVTVKDAWQALKMEPKARLVDVRTSAEWAFVGVPDLASISKSLVQIEWQSFPGGKIDEAFVEKCSKAVIGSGADRESPLYFICRSGARSLSAARAMSVAGFRHNFNITEGFEGPLDGHGHRGGVGWRAEGLPWRQS
jgi:rhodanese-related sulfurtransferase